MTTKMREEIDEIPAAAARLLDSSRTVISDAANALRDMPARSASACHGKKPCGGWAARLITPRSSGSTWLCKAPMAQSANSGSSSPSIAW